MEMSNLLNTGLDADTLAICVRLCENGVNPEALAMVIQELRRASAALKVCKTRFFFKVSCLIEFIQLLQ